MTTLENETAFIKTLQVGPLQCNCTIIGDIASGKAIVVDPGGDADKILGLLDEQGLQVVQVIHTHAHFDHFLASGDIHEKTGASLCLHKEDKPLWDNLDMQCGMYGLPFKPVPSPTHWLSHEEELQAGGVKGKAIHTPGHSPGSMSFHFEDFKLLIAGDTLFRGSIGRTDLWGGDSQTIEKSIRNQLYTLDEETRVVTGHGIATTIGYEKQHNGFIRA
jgi:glyoxylase-like metal-dependent hydrolase (beta-lactamase superfamily II)